MLGAQARDLLRLAVLLQRGSVHEAIFHARCAPTLVLRQRFFNGIASAGDIVQIKPHTHAALLAVLDYALHVLSLLSSDGV